LSPSGGNATAARTIQLGKNGSTSRLKRRSSHFYFRRESGGRRRGCPASTTKEVLVYLVKRAYPILEPKLLPHGCHRSQTARRDQRCARRPDLLPHFLYARTKCSETLRCDISMALCVALHQSERLDLLSLAMLAIPDQRMKVSISDAKVEAL